MNKPNLKEFTEKENRLHQFMDKNRYDAVLIGNQMDFSWFSCGGSSRTLITSEETSTFMLITMDKKYLVAYTMDAPRALEEELDGLGFEPKLIHWYDRSLGETALDLAKGKRILSDISLPGTVFNPKEFYNLHYPLTDWEIERYKTICKEAETTLRSVVDKASPGMKESEVEVMLMSEFIHQGFLPVVVLMGSDERIAKYRHLNATNKKIEKVLLLILAMRKFGLNTVFTRTVCFGDKLPDETEHRFKAASTIAAYCIANTIPGKHFADILEMQKRLYKELGYKDEWRNHFQGGITGYVVNDSSLCLDLKATIKDRQTFNWFITITGVNTEDTCISSSEGGVEIFTRTGAWPTQKYNAGTREISLPDVLYK